MKNNIPNSFVKFLLIIVFLSAIEDLLRRLIPEIPSYVLLLKTVLLFILFITYYNRFNTPIFHKITIRWSLLLIILILPHILTVSGIIRSILWYHSIVFLPFLIIAIMLQLNERQYLSVVKFIFLTSLVAALFALINYFTGTYSENNILGDTNTGGFRYFEGQKLYFNAGWFFGAERLAWFCAIGIAAGFIIIFTKRKLNKKYLIYSSIILLLVAAYSTARVTGFLLAISLFSFISLSLLFKNKAALLIVFLIASIFILNYQEIFRFIGSDTRALFLIEHSSTFEDRGAFHLENILNAIKYTPTFGLGPMPQGLQYIDLSNQVFTRFNAEGLISLSIVQFGASSFLHLLFNFIFIALSLRAIKKYNDYKFVIGFLLLILKIWIIKASQMESDTFAQVFLYIMITPLIKSYYIEMKQRNIKILNIST